MNAFNVDLQVYERIAASLGMSVEDLYDLDPDTIRALMDERKAELQRRVWLKDPNRWAKEKLGLFLWSKQREILQAMADHRKVAVQSCHEIGKALALDTPLATPVGWTTMGEVRVGDQLFDETGAPTTIVAVSPIEKRMSYRVTFSDKSHIIAADTHQWAVLDLTTRKRKVRDWRDHWDSTIIKTTSELAQTVKTGAFNRWRIPTAHALPDEWARRNDRDNTAQRSGRTIRTITAVEPVGECLVRCVEVDSPRHLYLAGRHLIPTHNSFLASLIVAWWIDTHVKGDAFAITTAPTGPQVKAVLWREIARRHSEGNLPGRMNTTEWLCQVASGKEELVAMGRKPSDYNPTAFQGLHAPALLFVIDEACGVPYSLWEAGDSLIANDDSKALAIGNPDDPTAEFKRVCSPGSGWFVVQVGAFDTPNFTGEDVPEKLAKNLIGELYVEEKRKRLAPTWRWNEAHTAVVPPDPEAIKTANPVWLSKVLGLFPENAVEGTLIPMTWVLAAQQRTLDAIGPVKLGVDVGGGGDSSTIAERRGPVVRIRHEDHNPDTMQTCGHAVAWYRKTNAEAVNVDTIGIGHGVVDRGVEQKLPFIGINVGEQAFEPENFVNRRAELWWDVRERFEQGLIDIDPGDEDLAGELVEIRFKRTSSGKIQIESKADAKARGVASPNRADALMLSFASPRPKKKGGTWGR